MAQPFEDKDEKGLPPQVSPVHPDSYYAEVVQPHEEETHRALKVESIILVGADRQARQISMIALGGAVGTGLVIGSGTALARSGPASLFIAYCTVGVA